LAGGNNSVSTLRAATACLTLIGAAVALALTPAVQALPMVGTVTTGVATIAQADGTTTVTQSSESAAINWQSFNIANGQKVDFAQPNSSAVVLNRVVGNDPSLIYGELNANGQVFLINSSGVLFGRSARINVGGLVASTLGLSDVDFLAGKRSFRGTSGSVVNQGELTAGYVAMLGGHVSNQGVIRANLGTVALAAGSQVTLDFAGDRLLSVAVDRSAVSALAENAELIVAAGGQVILTAHATNALLDTVVNNTGIIEARTLGGEAGTIRLLGDASGGTVKVSGTLDASAPSGGNGGKIDTSGAQVQVTSDAHISTVAAVGKTGTWLIDPTDFTIGAGAGAQTTSGIGATTLQANLGTGNVAITTSAGGTQSGDINVNAPVSWTANTLTLTAANNINVNAVMTVGGTAKVDFEPGGGGDLLMGFANDGTFAGQVNISSSAANALTINAQVYTIITALGSGPADVSGTTLQGMNGNLSGFYALGSNIDASATAGWSGGSFTIIGTGGYRTSSPGGFMGSFNGLGHTISNLTIHTYGAYGYNIGLFGAAQSTARISNIGIIGGASSIGGTGYGGVGALVGYNGGSIKNSFSNVSILGVYSGGLAGFNSGSIINSHALGSVGGSQNIGGLVGWNEPGGTITSSYSSGSVLGGSQIGGLVGYNHGTVTNSYSSSTVTSTAGSSVNSAAFGGLVGENRGPISTSFATGNVAGGELAGGLVGQNRSTITDSYATGAVSSGVGDTGGLVGDNIGTINRSYSTGSSNGGGAGGFQDGGLVSANGVGTVTNSFWDVTTSGITTGSAPGLTGLTTAQMQTMATFNSATTANGNVNPGWNFATAPITWKQGANLYPCLVGVSPGCVIVPAVALTVDVLFSGAPGTGTTTYGSALIGSGFGYELFQGATEVTPGGVTGTALYSGLPAITAPVGNYTVSYSSGLSDPGYTFSAGTSLSFFITPAPLTLSAANASKVYGHVPSLTGFIAAGLENGETVGSVAETSAGSVATAGVAAGPYAITASAAAGGTFTASNYAIRYNPGILTVTAAPLTVTADSVSKVAGQTASLTGFIAVGLQNGETIGSVTEFSPGSAATASTAGSPYGITTSAAKGGTFNAANYSIDYSSAGTLTVTPAGAVPPPDAATNSANTAAIVGVQQLAADLEPSGSVFRPDPLYSAVASTATEPVLGPGLPDETAVGDFEYERRGALNLGKTSLTILKGGVRGPTMAP
jgi:filamentous hemagglutinin family protein